MIERARRVLVIAAGLGVLVCGYASGATVIPPGSVAIVDGAPIARSTLDHWMRVAATSQAEQAPGQPVIVPTDPPGFTRCIAQVRKQIPTLKRTPAKTIRADCAKLYRSLSSQTLDFLIKADWIQADGARHGIVPSAAEVTRAFNTEKNQQFPNDAAYRAFLTKTGQTNQDVRFRVRVNLILSRLVAQEKGSVTARQNAVTDREKRLYQAQTRCAPLVVIADCGNYRAGRLTA